MTQEQEPNDNLRGMRLMFAGIVVIVVIVVIAGFVRVALTNSTLERPNATSADIFRRP